MGRSRFVSVEGSLFVSVSSPNEPGRMVFICLVFESDISLCEESVPYLGVLVGVWCGVSWFLFLVGVVIESGGSWGDGGGGALACRAKWMNDFGRDGAIRGAFS